MFPKLGQKMFSEYRSHLDLENGALPINIALECMYLSKTSIVHSTENVHLSIKEQKRKGFRH